MEFDNGPVEMPTKIQVSPVNTTAHTNTVQNQYITQTMDRYRKKKITSNYATTQDDIGVMNSTHGFGMHPSPTPQFYHEESKVHQSSKFDLAYFDGLVITLNHLCLIASDTILHEPILPLLALFRASARNTFFFVRFPFFFIFIHYHT